VSKAILPGGICSNCRHAHGCTYQKGPKHTVCECEEFEVEAGGPARLSGLDAVPSGSFSVDDPADDDLARYKGLCGNCEERAVCTFPKPEGGVWHCEEYR
jgi:hypothetical protein